MTRTWGRIETSGSRLGLAVVAGTLVLVGCGSGRPAKRAPTTPVPGHAAATGNGEAAKSALQILMDAAGAMRGVRGYRVQARITGSRLTRIGLTMNSPTAFDLTLGFDRNALEVIEVGGSSYLRANAAFLRARLGAGAAILGGRWVRVPMAATRGLTKATDAFIPGTLGRCLLENHGTLRVAGTATVAGQPAVVVEDAGDAPGAQPGRLYVAAMGPPYPLRVTGTGHQRAGGRVDVCNDGKASKAGAVATFSQFNRTPPVQAPASAAVPGGIQAA